MTPINIALVDDHAILRKPLTELINRMQNIKVCIDAGNGLELIEQLKTADVIPDIALVDVNMPGMDGFETTAWLARHYPTVKVLGLSQHGHEHVIVRMIRSGARGYVFKEIRPEELERCIHILYESGYYYNQLVDGHYSKWNDVPNLTPEEKSFLVYCTNDLSYKQISDVMILTPRKIESLREVLFRKLDIHSRAGLANYAIMNGFVKI